MLLPEGRFAGPPPGATPSWQNRARGRRYPLLALVNFRSEIRCILEATIGEIAPRHLTCPQLHRLIALAGVIPTWQSSAPLKLVHSLLRIYFHRLNGFQALV